MYPETNQKTRIFRFSLFQWLIGAFIVQALSGCATSAINATDNHVTTPSFRISVNLNKDEGQSASVPHSGSSIELGATRIKGSESQSLAAGTAPIILNGTTFAAPVTINNTFAMRYADLAWRGRKFFGERSVGMEWIVGLAQTTLDVNVASAAQQASRSYSTSGIEGGIGMVWLMTPSTSFHLRAAGYGSNSLTGVSSLGRFELLISQALGNNLALRLGYTQWSGNGTGNVGESNLHFKFSGPKLELGLCF